MKNGINEEAMQHVIERPSFLNNLSMKGGREKSLKIAKLAETMKLLEGTKCLQYDELEFNREWGGKKWSDNSLIASLKKHEMSPRLIRDNGKVYLWNRGV
jgi:hypothetical protein